jgi:cytochrome c
MTPSLRALAWSLVAFFISCAPTAAAAAQAPDRVLIFSRTAGFRHDSITVGAKTITDLATQMGLESEWSQDPSIFTDGDLARFGVVIFLSTTGDVLDEPQQAALERFIGAGRGWVGIHAAADTEYDWPWYQELVGGAFKSHPAVQQATIRVTDRTHPATSHLPERWIRTDEWYDYRENPRGNVHVLMSLDESSYNGAAMDATPAGDHPIAWCHHYAGGRAFYTGLGHTPESFAEPDFLQHLRGAITWTLGSDPQAAHDAGGTIWDHYEVEVIDDDTLDPMELAVTPDGRVIFIERGGLVKIWSEVGGQPSTRVAGVLNVTTALEDGLLGMALDPAFMDNGWIYIYYSPVGTNAHNRLSRFTLKDDVLDPASESIVIDVPTQRQECCHSGGSVAFGPDGLLYLSIGDNTNPFASDGFAPIDERPGRMPWDAQKSSASTGDLRGKILRIRPLRDGGYEIPDGNLFPKDGSIGRPEVYVMGCRNPFRISIDPVMNWLYFGDVGPDSDTISDTRGPKGHDEFNQIRTAANCGWPYFIGNNKTYHDYDFATEDPGAPFNPSAPVNDSPNRTGSRTLPPATPAWVWYPYGKSDEFPMMGSGGRCAMGGPTYRRAWLIERFGVLDEHALPPSMDGVTFMYEWARGKLFAVRTDDSGALLAIDAFLSDHTFIRPHELELGPDGRLYLIEWGSEFGGQNTDSRITRIGWYAQGKRPPRVVATAKPTNGATPLKVSFDARGSESRSGSKGTTGAGTPAPLEIGWDFDADGALDARGPVAEHTFTTPGVRRVCVTARDSAGMERSELVEVHAGNTAPAIRFETPAPGTIVADGDAIRYRVRVDDPEDSKSRGIEAPRLKVQLALRRGNVLTTLAESTGPEGSLTFGPEPEGDPNQPATIVLRATYTDAAAPGMPPLSADREIVLQRRIIEAERATTTRGTQVESKPDPASTAGASITALAFIEDGDLAAFSPVRLDGLGAIRFRCSSATKGGAIEIRLGSPKGDLIGITSIPSTGAWTSWTDIEAPIASPGGTHDLFLVFRGPKGFLFNLDSIELIPQ